jgi:hypothetical protein
VREVIDEKKLLDQLKKYKGEWRLAEPFHEGIAQGLQIAIEAVERQLQIEECNCRNCMDDGR